MMTIPQIWTRWIETDGLNHGRRKANCPVDCSSTSALNFILLEYLGIGTFRRGTMELTSAELGLAEGIEWDTNQMRRGRWTQRIEGYV